MDNYNRQEMELRERSPNSLEAVSNLPVVRKPVRLNEQQAYMLAAAIESVARNVDYDPNYGCGITDFGKTEPVRITKLQKEECIGYLKGKQEEASELFEEFKNDAFRRIPIKMYLEKLQKAIEFANQCPDNTFFQIPDEEAIEIELEVGSQLDRKYWSFVDRIIRDSRTRRVSPSIAAEYNRLKGELFISCPSLCLHHSLYNHLKEEFPFIEMLDDPRAFQGLLDLATEKNGRERTYSFLTGNERGNKTVRRLDYLAQRIGGFFGLPNQFIEGR